MSASSRIARLLHARHAISAVAANFTDGFFVGTKESMILDFLMPAHCAGCDAPGRDVCERCVAAIASPPAILLGARNGAPSLAALGPYDGMLRSAILAMKFRGARSIGTRLGRWLAPKIIFPFEAIVPVPLHSVRLRERGYNQAAEIARGIAAATRRPCIENALERVRATVPQSSLDLADRKGNVEGAFADGRCLDRVAGRRVLIVDDVVTSGATMRACAAVLRAAGVRTLYSAAAAVRL